MANLLDQIDAAAWWNILFLLLAIAGIVLAIYFYAKGLRVRIPVFGTKNVRLVGPSLAKLDALSIQFNGEAVRCLSLTTVALWNRGRQPIQPSDFAASDPLQLRAGNDVRILDVRIVHASTPQNQAVISLRPDGMVADIRFDYFGKNQGVVVELFHTGKTADDVVLQGTIRDVGAFRRYKVKDVMLDRIFNFTMGWIPGPPRRNDPMRPLKVALFIGYVSIVISVLFPLLVFTLFVDFILKYFRRPPAKEFLLE